ncbi:unknown protein [Seminavis robusta]|uniref:Uncharacterized protein n=1 Tax=Seminavis robusta TaxID=568900 RepID=A0A9N8EVX6_9STRA|nr:unknown protein [Seminavis robusta]|eukprot:Sro2052_g312610.1 n/a (171) ;mRNA; r:995-1507
MVKKDYTEYQSVWIFKGVYSWQVGSFLESRGPVFCGVQLVDGRKVRVKWTSIREIFEGPAEEGNFRWLERPGEWLSGTHYMVVDGVTVSHHHHHEAVVQMEADEIRRHGAWRPQNNNLYAMTGYRERQIQLDNTVLRLENNRLRERLDQLEGRIQQVEDFLHDSDIPSGL